MLKKIINMQENIIIEDFYRNPMMDAFDMESVFYSDSDIRKAKLKFINLVLEMEKHVANLVKCNPSNVMNMQLKVVETAYEILKQQYLYPSTRVRQNSRSELITHMLLNDSLDCDGSCFALFALSRRLGWNNIGIVNIPNHSILVIESQKGNSIYYDFGDRRTLHYYQEKFNYPKKLSDVTQNVMGKMIKGNLHGNIGLTWLQMDEPHNAIKELTFALGFNPADFRSLNNRGVAYQQLGEHDLAIADFTMAFKFDPNGSDVLVNRGCSYFAKGDFLSAKNDFLNSGMSFGFYNLASLYAQRNEISLALEYISKAIEYGFNDIAFMLEDEDLENVVGTSEFNELISCYFLN